MKSIMLCLILSGLCSCSTVLRKSDFEIPVSVVPSPFYTASVWCSSGYVIAIQCYDEDGSKKALRIFFEWPHGRGRLSTAPIHLHYDGVDRVIESKRDFRRLQLLLEHLAASQEYERLDHEWVKLRDALAAEYHEQLDKATEDARAAGNHGIADTAEIRLDAQMEYLSAFWDDYADRQGNQSVPGMAATMLKLLRARNEVAPVTENTRQVPSEAVTVDPFGLFGPQND